MASTAFVAPGLASGSSADAMGAPEPRQGGPRNPNGPPRILAISAHPADFCSRSGGTLIKYVKAGAKVKVIWLSHGATDESQTLYQKRPGISVEEVKSIREEEAFACVKVIGAEGKMFGFNDDPIKMTPERIEMLAKEIGDFDPTVILTHFKNELTYPSHWITAQSVITAAQLGHATFNIHFFEPNIGSASRVGFVPDHYVDITDVIEQKIAALKELPTQPNLVENYTSCNRWRGLESGSRYAEGFVRWMPKPAVNTLLE